MICPKCNTNNADNAKFCAGCGAELNANAPVSFGAPAQPAPEVTPIAPPPVEPASYVTPVAQAPAYAAPNYAAPAAPGMDYAAPVQKKSKLGLIIGIAAGAVAVIVAILLFIFLGGDSPEKAVEDYLNGIATGDGELVFERAVNPYVLADELADYDGTELEFRMDFSAEVYESYTENLEEYGSDATLKSFAVLSKTEYTEEDVAKIAAYAAEHCGIPYDAIEDVCLLSVYTEFGGSEDTDTDTDDVVMCKIDGKWYINIQGPDGSVTSKSRIKNILEG